MLDPPEKRLTEHEHGRLVERWKQLCREFAELADGEVSLNDAQRAGRKARLLSEMDNIASQLHEHWAARRQER